MSTLPSIFHMPSCGGAGAAILSLRISRRTAGCGRMGRASVSSLPNFRRNRPMRYCWSCLSCIVNESWKSSTPKASRIHLRMRPEGAQPRVGYKMNRVQRLGTVPPLLSERRSLT